MTGLPLIVFDVNETLVDLESLAPTFERIFGERSVLRLWFAQLVLYSEALTLAGTYVPFTDIGGAVLKMVATSCGTSVSAADRAELTQKFASMPPHPEVTDALRKLRHAGFRLCTLTNNTAEISRRQLERAGLLDSFERRFSVDDVRRHKPAPEVYAAVARAMQTQPSEICLVACHTWDTLGAVAAGWEAALKRRYPAPVWQTTGFSSPPFGGMRTKGVTVGLRPIAAVEHVLQAIAQTSASNGLCSISNTTPS
jgi:2-haloacid dehalogenase